MTTLDPGRQRKAKEYALISRRLWLVSTVISGGYLLAWLAFGWSGGVRDWLLATWPQLRNPWLLVPAYALIFGGCLALIDLPLSFYAGFVLPRRFEQSTQNLRGWLVDQLKSAAIGAPLGLLVLELLYLALRLSGASWWLWASGGLLVFNVLLANLAPVVIMPLFNKYVPLGEQHQDLAERLLRLAQRAGTRVRGVYTFDMSRRTKAANAALTGVGNTRRIVLGDTLIGEFTPDEIETVLAHELGHHVHRDILFLLALGSASTLLGLYLASMAMNWAVGVFHLGAVSDIAGLPALSLTLGLYGLLSGPLVNAMSRWRERMADAYALDATGKNDAFASAMIRLANQNLGEVDPEKWVVWMFHSHPPLSERIAAARHWRATPPPTTTSKP
jgi:STE24 endopeptidase